MILAGRPHVNAEKTQELRRFENGLRKPLHGVTTRGGLKGQSREVHIATGKDYAKLGPCTIRAAWKL